MKIRVLLAMFLAGVFLARPIVAAAAGPVWMPGFPLKAGSNVMLMWVPVGGATSYKVFRSSDPNSPGQAIADSAANNFMDQNVPSDKTFYYTVRAVVGGKEGDPSPQGVIKGIEPLAKPAIEGALPVEGGVTLRWPANPKAAFYNVYRAEKKDGPYSLLGSTQDARYTDKGIKPGKEYFFQVTAVDTSSSESPRSDAFRFALVEEKKKEAEKVYPLVPKVVRRVKNFYGEKGHELAGPTDVAVAPDGKVYVSDDGRRIQVFDAEGTYLAGIAGPPSDREAAAWGIPWGIDVGPDGRIYVAYTGAPVVRVFNDAGELLLTIPVEKPPASQLDNNSVLLTPGAFDVAVGVDGTIWVTDSTFFQLIGYSKEGKEIKRLGKPRPRETSDENFLVPTFITVDRATGAIAMVEAANQRVTVLDKDGKRLRWFGGGGTLLGKFSIPKGIAVDPAGDVAVMDGGSARLQAFDGKTGDLKYVYTDENKKAFEMGAYAGIAFNPKTKLLYTAEKGMRRVNIFKLD